MIEAGKFKAPRLSYLEIRRKADEFRQKYAPDGILPIKIEDIAEFDLHLTLDPVEYLQSTGDVEALLLGTGDRIIVDKEQFMDPRQQNRLRFSIAHEIGHLELHRNSVAEIRPASVEEWVTSVSERDDREHFLVEQHAYEFAGRLLVPRENLIADLRTSKSKVDEIFQVFPDASQEDVKSYVANFICKNYGVSWQVLKRRIDKEGLWPIDPQK